MKCKLLFFSFVEAADGLKPLLLSEILFYLFFYIERASLARSFAQRNMVHINSSKLWYSTNIIKCHFLNSDQFQIFASSGLEKVITLSIHDNGNVIVYGWVRNQS